MTPSRSWPLVLVLLAAACRYTEKSGDSPLVLDSPPDDSETSTPTPTDDTHDSVDTTETGTIPDGPLNVLLILTDDQRYDSMWPMPYTTEVFGKTALTFTNGYVNTPMCCPARASLLSGGYYASENGVRSNSQPNGGVTRFRDDNSLAVHLQAAGYRTGIVGKYLNEYPDLAPYVPPGWDSFEASLTETEWNSYEWVSGSSGATSSTGTEYTVDQYITDRVTDQARAFIEADDGRPFFLFVSHSAPHYPMTPDPADDGAYEGALNRGDAWQEADVSDKPEHIREIPVGDEGTTNLNDSRYADAMETLPAVDRSVETLLGTLSAMGMDRNTLVIYASDNGFEWGEHRLYTKGLPYAESVRVPLIVRWPGMATGTVDVLASLTTDVPATIYDAAGIPETGTQGRSMRELFEGKTSEWPDSLFIEAESEGASYPTWAGLVTAEWKYVEYTSGELELYDLVNDPAELESLHADASQASRIESLSAELAGLKGIAIGPIDILMSVGERVDRALPAVGGTGPYTWSITDGELPDGVGLAADGNLYGVPTTETRSSATFRVVGSSVSAYTGEPHDDLQSGFFTVGGPRSLRFVRPPAVVGAPGASRLVFTLSEELPVLVWVGPSPDFDDNPRRIVARPLGAGRYEVDLTGLRRGSGWFYRVQAAGRPVGEPGSIVLP